ncbi:Crp/Fnr family transcriptional regulator [Paenibacillus hamazuiensis]|uniref:Crp/Fnr family transcriptional regulator n=1 Tax=Paenibacillus hamazuiensis TaxID=2936508 RepID=UPI00200EFBC3|nr:Crp/Fnr family transcriptional regulator [Paenibacillus hamazuiensis]
MARYNLEQHILCETFPCFRSLSPDEWSAAQPRLRTFPAKSALFRGEDAVEYALFLISGTVRISYVTEDGSEAVSGRLSAGDICALMVLSGLSEREYPGTMTAETEVTALFVAKGAFLRWIQTYAPIRNAVFGNILDGFIDIGRLLAGKMSLPLDSRLAGVLLRLTTEREPAARITHRQLAAELGSAREVVSRALGKMQKAGWIETGRGSVIIRQRKALEALADDVGDRVTDT